LSLVHGAGNLAQHLICLACGRDLNEVEAYRKRVAEDASTTSVKGFDPAVRPIRHFRQMRAEIFECTAG
jgi:hypothetical protein